MQVWSDITIQFGTNGQPDLAAVARIRITDEKHRARSAEGDAISVEWEQQVPLPEEARNGGALTADPNTTAQRRLTQSMLWTSFMNLHAFIGIAVMATRFMCKAII